MGFFEGYTTKYVHNTIVLDTDSSKIWDEITNVKVANFKFPWFFSLIGIPKPLSAEVIKKGVGGYRVASFSNNAKFHQEILVWELHKKYRFKFNPTNNFKVGHFMKLSNGPFQIETGGYELLKDKDGVKLLLSSNYTLNGFLGKMMHIPFRLVVYLFQRYLLKGIESNLQIQKAS